MGDNVNRTEFEGNLVILTCFIKGIPQPITRWSSPINSRVNITTAPAIVDSQGSFRIISTLVMQNVLRTYSGNYTCTASNRFSLKEVIFDLNVLCKCTSFVSQSFYLYIYSSIYLSVIYPSIHPLIYPSTHPFIPFFLSSLIYSILGCNLRKI